MIRWRIAIMVSVAIAISYLDRQSLPVAVVEITKDIPINDQHFARLNTAFLVTYGLMYLGGGWLMDFLGTRRGFAIIMIFWSLACASHGFATSFIMLAASRLLLGVGEGGGFPAATRAVAEWFPVKERSTAMGIMNGGTAVGGIVAPPLIALVVAYTGWFSLAPWRWVFILTGAMGLVWTLWWIISYYPPEQHRQVTAAERSLIQSGAPVASQGSEPPIPLSRLLSYPQTWAIVTAKFLSDAAWYFILFWLPKFLRATYGFDIKAVGSVAWIPHAAAGIGCLVGGGLSSWLLVRGLSVNKSRKIALGVSAAVMPLLILAPHVPVWAAILLFCVGYFGQQSWSTLVMILPTDLFPRRAVGTVAGMVGLGGAFGGIAFGELAGWLLDHHFGYGPVFAIAGLLHLAAFVVILIGAPTIQPLVIQVPERGFEVVASK
ncbi:MAG TPA: MFS transporter [Tepidisphaeraceae bacterium]|jgi:ACS family hexuronate transporter-like MFS transporter